MGPKLRHPTVPVCCQGCPWLHFSSLNAQLYAPLTDVPVSIAQSGSLTLQTDSLLYLVASLRDRGSSVTVYPEGMIIRNTRTWKAPLGTHAVLMFCCMSPFALLLEFKVACAMWLQARAS